MNQSSVIGFQLKKKKNLSQLNTTACSYDMYTVYWCRNWTVITNHV